MEKDSRTEELENKNLYKNKVHKILAYSYFFFFICFLFGFFLDFLFPILVFRSTIILWFGFILLAVGTYLILWAQKSSSKLKKENLSKESFYYGPYRYTRSPTHFGLFLLTVGFGIISNAFFIIFFSIISFIVTRLVFIREQERVLAKKYGTPYLEYKKLVKF